MGEIETSSTSTVREGTDPATGEGGVAASGFVPLGEPGVAGRTTSLSFDPSGTTRVLAGGDMLGVALADDPLEGWSTTTGFLSWEMSQSTWSPHNPDEVWIGSMSGPHRSYDGGVTWEPARSGMGDLDPTAYSAPVEVVLFDPVDAERLLAFGGSQRQWQRDFFQGAPAYGTIWESTDNGSFWRELSVLAGRPIIQSAAINADGSSIYVAALAIDQDQGQGQGQGQDGMLRSDDGGSNWTPINNGLPHRSVVDVIAHPTDPLIAWAALTSQAPPAGSDGAPLLGGIFRTTDGGQNWTRAVNGLIELQGDLADNTASYERIVVAPSNPDRLYTSNVARGQIGLFSSDDGGENWNRLADADLTRPEAYQSSVRALELAVHPSNPDQVMFSQDDYILGSTDGGQTWTDLTTSEVRDGRFEGRGYSGMVSNDVAFSPFTEDTLAIAAFDGGNFIGSTDGGLSWHRPLTDIDTNWGGAEEIRFATESRVYVLLGQATANFRGVGVSDDGGETFSIRAGEGIGLPITRSDLDPTALAVDPTDPQRVAVVVEGVVYLSEDGADSFRTIMPEAGFATDVEFDASAEPVIWVSSDTGLWASFNGGQSAVTAEGSPQNLTRLTISADVPGTVFVARYADDNGGLFRFDGNDWAVLVDDPQVHEVAIQPGNAQVMVAVSTDQPRRDQSLGSGVLISTDGGENWQIRNEGLPMTRVATVAFDPFDPDRIVVGTTGRGFYEASVAGLLANG